MTDETDAGASSAGEPIATAEIGGYRIQYFTEPGLCAAPVGNGDEAKTWAVEKTIQHSIILSAVVRELLVLRERIVALEEIRAAIDPLHGVEIPY